MKLTKSLSIYKTIYKVALPVVGYRTISIIIRWFGVRSCKMPANIKLLSLATFLAFMIVAPDLSAWGPISHIALTYEAGTQKGFPVSNDLLGAYLAGSTEPDIGLDDGQSEDYGVYHSEDFAKAMESVASTKKSPARELLMARAAGIRSHLAGDSSAHGSNGYSDNKKMFDSLNTGLPIHTTNELCADIVMYDRNKAGLKNQSLNFMDVDTLIAVRDAYSRMTGKPLSSDREKLKKELLNHRTLVLTELSLANHLSNSDQAKLKEMREVYADLDTGVADGKGATMAISRIAEKAKPCEDLSNFRTTDRGAKIRDFLNNSLLAKSFQALERGVLKLTRSAAVRGTALDFASSKVSTTRNKAFVNFGINLLNRNLTFKQAAVMAGKAVSGYPADPAQKMAYLEIEAESLKAQRDKAMHDFNARPWWKFWLYFTQSDRKNYENLAAAYKQKMHEIDLLKATAEKDTPAASQGQIAGSATNGAVASTVSTTDLNALQTAVDKAYQKYVEATEAQDTLKASAAAEELEKARTALNNAKASAD